MKKLQAAVAAVTLSAASAALAAGDSGTSSAGEMQLSGAQFGMLVGGLVGLGVVVWLVSKVVSR
jgi:Na+/glutamate symporter